MDAKLQRFDAFLTAYAEKEEFSGAVRLCVGGESVFSRFFGYADRERRIPVARNTVFRFYSMTKPFTAMAFMLLAERGGLCLDSHPSSVLPEAEGLDGRITFRNILNHTCGLNDAVTREAFTSREAPDLGAMVRSLAGQPLRFAPGSGTFYANINFVIPALAVERVSGMPFREFTAQNVLAPLGMKTARFAGTPVPPGLTDALGYAYGEQGFTPAAYLNLDAMTGAADILGTVDDVTCLYRAVRERRLLARRSWDEVLTPSGAGEFGLGCAVYGTQGRYTVRHNGGHYGFRSLQRWYREADLSLQILCNTERGEPREDIGAAADVIFFGDGCAAALPEMDNLKKY